MAGVLAVVAIIAVVAGAGVFFLMGGMGGGPSDHTVTFSSENGTVDHASIEVEDGTAYKQPDSGSTLLFDDGQKIIVMPKDGYKFDSWSQPSGVVKNNMSLTAKCVQVGKDDYTISFKVQGQGSVTGSIVVEKGTTFAASGNTLNFSDGQKVIATPASGYNFSSWDTPGGTVTGNMTITAIFTEIPVSSYQVSFTKSGEGSLPSAITVKAGTKFSSTDKTLSFDDGQTVTAEPAADYTFGSWNPSSGTVTNNMTIQIVYNKQGATDFTVKINAGTGGSVDKASLTVQKDVTWSSSGSTLTFSDGQKVNATATSGYTFDAWNPASGTVTSDVTITASFTGGGGEEKTVSFLFCDNFENDGFESTTVFDTFFYPIIPSIWIHGTGTDMGSALSDACKTFDNASISITDGKITEINGVKDGNIYLWGWKGGSWTDKNDSGEFLTLNDLTITDYDHVAVVHGAASSSGTAPTPTSEPGKEGWYYGEKGGPVEQGKEVKFYLDVNYIYTTYETDVEKHSDPLTLLVPGIWIKGYANPGSLVVVAFTNALDRIGYSYNIDPTGFVNYINDCSGGNFLHSIWDNASGKWFEDTGKHWFGVDYVDEVDYAGMTYGAWGGETGYDTPPWPKVGAGDYKWGY